MILNQPDMIGRTCELCVKWMYHDGERLSGRRMERRSGPVERPPATPTPCHKCVKAKNPTEGKGVDRDLPRVLHAVELFNVSRATGGRGLSKQLLADGITLRNLGIVQQAFADYEGGQTAETLLPILAATRGAKR